MNTHINMGLNCITQQLSKTNLYIRGLQENTTDKDLINMCAPYGNIVSTKAILDPKTKKCRGYGFVDFELPQYADGAVKGLQAKGVQAQMAKVGILLHRPETHQEQDPTNLYLANLPPRYNESDLESLLMTYGVVISTRVLRDALKNSRGVGFARLQTREECERIIEALKGCILPGAKDALLIKYADGGPKKKPFKPMDFNERAWRFNSAEGIPVAYDPTMQQNGVGLNVGAHLGMPYSRFGASQVGGYPMAGSPWIQSYMLPQAMTPDEQYLQMAAASQLGVGPYKPDGINQMPPRGMMMLGGDTPMPYGAMMPGLAALQQVGNPYINTTYPYYVSPTIIPAIPMTDSEQASTAATPDEAYLQYSHPAVAP